MRPQTWLDELAHELTARGIAGTQVASIVVEAECHLRETASPPLAVFGSPAAYAASVADALEPEVEREVGAIRVRARGVCKRYGAQRVLEDVDLDLRDGEAVLLMGANGAGKSTLLRILAGLADADRGEVSIGGRVGYAPQDGGLIDQLRPAEHFVLFGRGRGLSRERAVQDGRRLAEQLGWDALAAPVAGELSGGTRQEFVEEWSVRPMWCSRCGCAAAGAPEFFNGLQKLNVILAALGEPHVLLLDEPYQGLDLDSVQRFWELLWAWRDAGRCALVVSHAHDALDRADAVVDL